MLSTEELLGQVERYREALSLAATRLEILTGRARGCHEETGRHELLEEAEGFCIEARQSLALLAADPYNLLQTTTKQVCDECGQPARAVCDCGNCGGSVRCRDHPDYRHVDHNCSDACCARDHSV